jgi:hypothetical protein
VKATLIQAAPFVTEWRRHRLTDEDLRELESAVMERPMAGAVMSGTGGLRKVRFAPASRYTGKSGAFRVCYAFFPAYDTIVFVALFAKNEKDNMTAAGRAAAKKTIQAFAKGLVRQRGAKP